MPDSTKRGNTMVKTALAVVAIAAALCGTAYADDGVGGTFLGGTCNGTVDVGCRYCSYNGGGAAEPVSSCYGQVDGFRWTSCGTWADGYCYAVVRFTTCSNLTC
jgi:hypothetical protein